MKTEIIGIILMIIGIVLFIGALIYIGWSIHPAAGILFSGIAIAAIGKTITEYNKY